MTCDPAPGRLRNGRAGMGPGLEYFEILDANSCFLAHFSARKLTPARVNTKTGQLAFRPGLQRVARQRGQKTGRPDKAAWVATGNPT